MENELIKKVDILIEQQKRTNILLEDLIKIFKQYDVSYNMLIESDGIKLPELDKK
jgi:hypothetical protein